MISDRGPPSARCSERPRGCAAPPLHALLADVRLPTDGGLADRRPGALSGGQQRRARARHPAVLLLDEPTVDLDPHLGDEIGELLRHLAERHRIAVALSCHDAALAARLADDVVELPSGAGARAVRVPAPRAVRPEKADRPDRPVLSVTGLTAAFRHRGRAVPTLQASTSHSPQAAAWAWSAPPARARPR
ncbi:hypothetical protein AB0M64_03840 [Streptomyces sp. NPDC051771]|uniref:hypothetical protein n=1 Tax=Streptomyces sp. NPDC051771 TaxID=3154847 RepID=UPI00341F8127